MTDPTGLAALLSVMADKRHQLEMNGDEHTTSMTLEAAAQRIMKLEFALRYLLEHHDHKCDNVNNCPEAEAARKLV